MTTLFISDERIEAIDGALQTEAAPTGGFLDLCEGEPDLHLLVRPCPSERRHFSTEKARLPHVRHLPDWKRREIVRLFPQIAIAVWRRARKADRIIAVMPSFSGFSACGLASLGLLSQPLLVLVRGHLTEQYDAQADAQSRTSRAMLKMLGFLSRLALRKADKVVCVSHYLGKTLSGVKYSVAPEIDWQSLSGISIEPVNRAGVLYVGRLESEKSPEIVVQAAMVVPDEPLPLRLIGAGSLKGKLMAISSVSQPTQGNVQFLGTMDHDEVLRQMSLAKVVVVPSASEGFGLVALEAIAAGAIVVCANTGGLPEAVGWSPSAVLVDSRDPIVWHAKILDALSSPTQPPPIFDDSFREGRGWTRLTSVLATMRA